MKGALDPYQSMMSLKLEVDSAHCCKWLYPTGSIWPRGGDILQKDEWGVIETGDRGEEAGGLYLKSTVQNNRECEEDMKRCMQASWNGWWKMWCNKKDVSRKEKKSIQVHGESSHVFWLWDSSSEKESGDKSEDVEVLSVSDEDLWIRNEQLMLDLLRINAGTLHYVRRIIILTKGRWGCN